MGTKDNVSSEYMKQNRIFADVFNYMFYQGEERIVSENLFEKDTVQIFNSLDKKDKIKINRMRDVLKCCILKSDSHMDYLLLGIENQSDINYAMPVRIMLYDALSYTIQVEQIAKDNKVMKKYNNTTEFISGFLKEDRIKPVCTVVIYFGPKEWDAPRSLYEMFDLDDELKKYIPDFKINLIIPREIEDFSKFDTELGKVLQFIKCSEDKDSLKELMRNDSSYECLDGDTAKMIGAFTNVKIKVKGGVCNMCKAVEDMIKENEIEVTERVERETVERVQRETIISMLEDGISDERIIKILKISSEYLEEIKERK